MQYDNMKTSQLVNLLAKRNLKTTGSKHKLISRLEKHDKKTLIVEYDRYIARLEEDAYVLVQHMPTHEERVYYDMDDDDPTYYKARSDEELVGKWLVHNSEWAIEWLNDLADEVCEQVFEQQIDDLHGYIDRMILDRMEAIEII